MVPEFSKSLTKTFQVRVKSEIDGEIYSGQFTTKKLTIGGMIQMGTVKSQLAGGLSYNPTSGKGLPFAQEILCEMIAHCQVALISSPTWFSNPQDLNDVAILRAVYEEVSSFEESFRPDSTKSDGGRGEGENSQGTESEREGSDDSALESQRRSAPTLAAVVGEQIPKVTQVS